MDFRTSYLPPVFFRFSQQIIHFIGIPVFFFLFATLYCPFDLKEVLELRYGGFAFNSAIISSILFVILFLTRTVLWGLRNISTFRRSTYVFWCVAEVLVSSLFISLYVTLMSGRTHTYIDVLPTVLGELSAILVYPYLLLTLILESALMSRYSVSDTDNSKMRFYDEKHKLKLVAEPRSVLYIQSDENYCNIFYTEGGHVKSLMLRSTMKSLENMCSKYGIFRCHRSYYVNVSRIKVLRREKESLNMAELDVTDVPNIPVTPRYYDQISAML